MTLHGSSPVTAAVNTSILRLRTNGSGVHNDFSTHQSHDTSSLGEPLIPADSNTQLAVLSIPDLEASITGVEVELLFITGTIGNVRLSVHTEDFTISINNSNGVVISLVILLEEGNGKNNFEFLSNLLEVSNQSRSSSRFSLSKRRLLLILSHKNEFRHIPGRNTNQQRVPEEE